jgi:hypothetical protein
MAPTEVKVDLCQKGSDESYSVTYDLFESSEVLRYPGRSEVRRKVQLRGTVARFPKVLNHLVARIS